MEVYLNLELPLEKTGEIDMNKQKGGMLVTTIFIVVVLGLISAAAMEMYVGFTQRTVEKGESSIFETSSILTLSRSYKLLTQECFTQGYVPESVSCVYTSESVTMANSIIIYGDVTSTSGGVIVSNHSIVEGNIYATGNVALRPNAIVQGDICAGGSISIHGNSSHNGLILSYPSCMP